MPVSRKVKSKLRSMSEGGRELASKESCCNYPSHAELGMGFQERQRLKSLNKYFTHIGVGLNKFCKGNRVDYPWLVSLRGGEFLMF